MRYIFICIFAAGTASLMMNARNPYYPELSGLSGGEVPGITPREIDTLSERPLWLDTRELEEYRVSHIPGAVNAGYEDLMEASLLRIEKDRLIITYCTVGYRSGKVAETLRELGFNRVYNLHGGIFEWVNAGRTVVDAQGIPTDRVHTYNKAWSVLLRKGTGVYD